MPFEPQDPLDINALLFQLRMAIQRMLPKAGRIIGGVLILWLMTGFYIVQPDEMGVVKRFGAISSVAPPGPHYHLPYPIETVLRPKVTKVHRTEIGFRTVDIGPPAQYRSIPEEALMLTGDENIASVEFIVQYRIKNAMEYLFAIAWVDPTIKASAEAAMREIIGKNKIDEVLTTGKAMIQEGTLVLLQKILDDYKAGVQIVAVQLQDVRPPEPVSEAFKDVASAREDKEKLINQAQSYQNDIMPKAQGEAAQNVNRAQGYAQARIKRAEGEANRFLKSLVEYRKGPDVIRKRIYIETVEEVFTGMEKFIIDGKAGERLMPYLSLKDLKSSENITK